MIRRASTAALRYSSELLFLRQARSAPPGWRVVGGMSRERENGSIAHQMEELRCWT